MKEKIKQKLKSYSFWTSFSAALIIMFETCGKIFGFSINAEDVSNLIMAFCGILVVLGVVTMPTNKTEAISVSEESLAEQEKAKEGIDKK